MGTHLFSPHPDRTERFREAWARNFESVPRYSGVPSTGHGVKYVRTLPLGSATTSLPANVDSDLGDY